MLAFLLFIFLQIEASHAQQTCIELFSTHNLRAELGNYYELVEGNSSLAEARVIFIGDIHGRGEIPPLPEVTFAEAKALELLMRFLKPSDVVLVEQAKEGRVLDNLPASWRAYFSEQGARVKGWDRQDLRILAEHILQDSSALSVELMKGTGPTADPVLFEQYLLHQLLFERVGIELRDEHLAEQLEEALRQIQPGSKQKIFITAGTLHSLDYTGSIRGILERYQASYIILKAPDATPTVDYGKLREWALETYKYEDWELDSFILRWADALVSGGVAKP